MYLVRMVKAFSFTAEKRGNSVYAEKEHSSEKPLSTSVLCGKNYSILHFETPPEIITSLA